MRLIKQVCAKMQKFSSAEEIANDLVEFHAVPLPSSEHQYRFMLSDDATQKIREVYDYAWSDECI